MPPRPMFNGIKKKTIKSVALAVFLLTIMLLVYQFVLVQMIEDYNRRNIHDSEVLKMPDKMDLSGSETRKFICSPSGLMIPQHKVNDDYCDCPDGSDEPKTNACRNSYFQCQQQKSVRIPSSRVNDGICDCCDGSDEWKGNVSPIALSYEAQKKAGVFLSPCTYRCIKLR